jgi:hypothetical protein
MFHVSAPSESWLKAAILRRDAHSTKVDGSAKRELIETVLGFHHDRRPESTGVTPVVAAEPRSFLRWFAVSPKLTIGPVSGIDSGWQKTRYRG